MRRRPSVAVMTLLCGGCFSDGGTASASATADGGSSTTATSTSPTGSGATGSAGATGTTLDDTGLPTGPGFACDQPPFEFRATEAPIGATAQAVVAGDFMGSPDLEFAVAIPGTVVPVFGFDGSQLSTVAEPASIEGVGDDSTDLRAVDYSGDDRPDLLVAYAISSGGGLVGFESGPTLTRQLTGVFVGFPITRIAAGRLDDTPGTDYAVAGGAGVSSGVAVVFGDAQGPSDTPAPTGFGNIDPDAVEGLVVADVTQDGLDDIVVVSSRPGIGGLRRWRREMGAGFTLEGWEMTNRLVAVKLLDLDLALGPDLLLAHGAGLLTLIHPGGTGPLTLPDPSEAFGPNNPIAIEVADMTCDGVLDIVAAYQGESVLRIFVAQNMAGETTFAAPVLLDAGGDIVGHRFAVGDYNGDELADIAVATNAGTGTLRVMLRTLARR